MGVLCSLLHSTGLCSPSLGTEQTEDIAAVSASFAKKADINGPLVDPDKKGISLEYLGIERFDMSELHPHSASAFLDHLFQATSISDIVIMRCVLNQS